MGLISINLAVVNFLPIPILDGGHMVFLVYEWIPPQAGIGDGAHLGDVRRPRDDPLFDDLRVHHRHQPVRL